IDSLGLHESVKLLGKKQKTEIVDILTRSDAFILPSRAENFSVAVLEALALGLPAIATVCGGIRECINQNNGLLVEVDNVKKMAGAMLDMVRNYSRYDNNSIRERCLTLYGPTTIAKGLVKVYEEAIKNTK
ncbi:MAG: glycosyltransferase, partial [Muribaculaceae bacterium]|nr:glycosyltransferase [Muribaculaceae bacterium]